VIGENEEKGIRKGELTGLHKTCGRKCEVKVKLSLYRNI
jgi:hypothetical protein